LGFGGADPADLCRIADATGIFADRKACSVDLPKAICAVFTGCVAAITIVDTSSTISGPLPEGGVFPNVNKHK
jgi:hypothetical protein